MSAFEQQMITSALTELYRNIGGPVPTVAVAVRLCFSPRHMQRKLNTAFEAGFVQRVGQRKGWIPLLS